MRHTRHWYALMSRPGPATFTILVIDDDPGLLELASELLSGDGHPVVALTSGTAEDAKRLSRAGSVGFILKPFEPAEFLRLITNILNATVGRSQRHSEGAR